MSYELEVRVDRLETLLSQFIVQTGTALTRLERGLESFKNEMKVFKDEMRGFKDEMSDFKDEMRSFKDEMRSFKDEMREYKNEQEKKTRQMNKQWGDLANKWGTLVEDLVFPSIPQIILQKFNEDVEDNMVRRKRKLPEGRTKEFDLIALSKEHVFLNSTKSTLKSQYVDDFVEEINLFWELFPEYRNKKLIGIMASLYIDESVMSYAERTSFLVLGVGMEVMEIKNRAEFEPKIWIYNP
jgi:hypothetical protein